MYRRPWSSSSLKSTPSLLGNNMTRRCHVTKNIRQGSHCLFVPLRFISKWCDGGLESMVPQRIGTNDNKQNQCLNSPQPSQAVDVVSISFRHDVFLPPQCSDSESRAGSGVRIISRGVSFGQNTNDLALQSPTRRTTKINEQILHHVAPCAAKSTLIVCLKLGRQDCCGNDLSCCGSSQFFEYDVNHCYNT